MSKNAKKIIKDDPCQRVICLDQRFAKTLKRLRRKQRVSLPKLAQATGFSLKYLKQIEAGEEEISFDDFPAMANGLGLTVRELSREVEFDQNPGLKRKSRRALRIHYEFQTGDFKKEVCLYINDCMQYLKAASEKKSVDYEKDGFDSTKDEFLIIYGLKELKDLCMRTYGMEPLNWKDNRIK